MGFKKKYTDQDVIDALTANHVMSSTQLAECIGCHKNTINTLIRSMGHAGQVVRFNARSEKKPLWVYSLKSEMMTNE